MGVVGVGVDDDALRVMDGETDLTIVLRFCNGRGLVVLCKAGLGGSGGVADRTGDAPRYE